uniref:Uncharacterized protein n=1 Tax=Anguilla anguilla TaxID=7936 RepID=A0A0E9UHV6_ANGAN
MHPSHITGCRSVTFALQVPQYYRRASANLRIDVCSTLLGEVFTVSLTI